MILKGGREDFGFLIESSGWKYSIVFHSRTLSWDALRISLNLFIMQMLVGKYGRNQDVRGDMPSVGERNDTADWAGLGWCT